MKTTPKIDKRNVSTTFAMAFSFLFITTSIAAFILVFGLKFIIMRNYHSFAPVNVFMGMKMRPIREIVEYPFPYLLSISFFLALLGACWIRFVAPRLKRFHHLQMLVIPWIAMFFTTPIWGLIWSMFTKPPASFSNTSMMMDFYQYHTAQALNLGWVSAVFSFPANFLSYIIAYTLLILSRKFYFHANASS